jgi:hypothetical protein
MMSKEYSNVASMSCVKHMMPATKTANILAELRNERRGRPIVHWYNLITSRSTQTSIASKIVTIDWNFGGSGDTPNSAITSQK